MFPSVASSLLTVVLAQAATPATPTPNAASSKLTTLSGCIERDRTAPGQFTFADSDGISRFRLTGKNLKKFVGMGADLVAFSGGTITQLVSAANCTAPTLAFWTIVNGDFVGYIPGAQIAAVNAELEGAGRVLGATQQHLPLAHLVTLVERDALDEPPDLGAHRRGLARLDGARRDEGVRHDARLGATEGHRDARTARRRGLGAPRDHGGELTLHDRKPHGLIARITLPGAAAARA